MHLHLTKQQWSGILKWTLYAFFTLFVYLTQSILCAQHPIFGCKLILVPAVLVCICIREGAERGGLFCLIASVVLCLAQTDGGSLSVALLTVLAILSTVLCRSVLTNGLWSVALCCFAVSSLNETAVLFFHCVLDRAAISNLWRVALPACVLSVPICPLFYITVKAIGKIGVRYGV